MKKRKLAAGIAAAALVAVLSVSAVYAGNQGKSVSALWGEILKQSADEEKINTQSADDEPLYAVGKDVSITMKEYEQVKSFYKLKSEDDGQAAKDADKEIKQYNALYAAAVKNGYSVTDEQVQAYIEDMKLQLESVDNSEDIQDVIDQFDSEDDYWAYEFTVYQKQLPIQNYVSALNDEYNEKAVDSSSEEAQEEWDTYFENLKDKLVKSRISKSIIKGNEKPQEPGEHRKAVLTNENSLIIMRIMSKIVEVREKNRIFLTSAMRHKNEAKAVKERSNRTTAQQRVAGR